MKPLKYIYIVVLCSMLTGCVQKEDARTTVGRDTVKAIAQTLNVTYAVSHNKYDVDCILPNNSNMIARGNCHESSIYLESDVDILGKDWEIYYSQVNLVVNAQSDEFTIDHINGDLHRIRPTDLFSGFAAGVGKTIHLVGAGHILSESVLMPNYYVVAKGVKAKTIESTRLQFDPQTGLVIRPYAAPLNDIDNLFRTSANDHTVLADAHYLYKANQGVIAAKQSVVAAGIIPTPSSVILNDTGLYLDLSKGVHVEFDPEGKGAALIAAALERLALLGVPQNKRGVPIHISLVSPPTNSTESYTLEITDHDIQIVGTDEAGVFYGLMSVASLLQLGDAIVPEIRIEDAPRFSFRGMHIDVARNFHSKDEILKVIDQMAAYKLNKLHLHLADDEGWRLEISGLPELTDIGAKRCHDPQEQTCLLAQLGAGPTGRSGVNGYYSVADYIEILKFANARNIQVIPSLDMPGHARAAIKSMEARYYKFMKAGDPISATQYLLSDLEDASEYKSIQFYSDNTINPCMGSTFVFLEKMIDEMQKMHKEAGQELTRYHIGADETAGAWTKSPICDVFYKNNTDGIKTSEELGPYFLERMVAMLDSRGIIAGAWNDGLDHVQSERLPKNVHSNIWSVLPWGGSSPAHKHVKEGWDVVLSYPDVMYFDFPYEADPKESGYSWAARHVNSRKVFEFMPGNTPIHAEFWKDMQDNAFEIKDENPLPVGAEFAGIQGQVWSETIATDSGLDYHIFPRFLSLAERAWHKADWEVSYNHKGGVYNEHTSNFTTQARTKRDLAWQNFASIIGKKEMAKLDIANVNYRIPTVGAVIDEGVLSANVAFPSLTIEYKESDGAWVTYFAPVDVKGQVEIRARSADNSRAGRTLIVPYVE